MPHTHNIHTHIQTYPHKQTTTAPLPHLEILCNFSHKALKRQLGEQDIGGFLIATDLPESHGARPIAMWLLYSARPRQDATPQIIGPRQTQQAACERHNEFQSTRQSPTLTSCAAFSCVETSRRLTCVLFVLSYTQTPTNAHKPQVRKRITYSMPTEPYCNENDPPIVQHVWTFNICGAVYKFVHTSIAFKPL